ncbi:MAG: 50S ribosomal protein L22 [Clostridia bacterium]|nr:50S ribosomal protein L22 [Clostridia bacterium]MBO4517911.1 50S ribosomal protein L22 [Clostridia bacterium]MBR0189335.1 50S ribosomal protein L22 [Clostridia bacterium]
MAKNLREKTAKIAENKDRRPKAVAKHVRISPYKVRIVLDIIRGKGYREAVAILENTPKAASEPVKKVLMSAAANAENNLGLSKDNLYVAACFADQGPTLKRVMPRAQGRAFRILKRTSHITVVLDAKA